MSEQMGCTMLGWGESHPNKSTCYTLGAILPLPLGVQFSVPPPLQNLFALIRAMVDWALKPSDLSTYHYRMVSLDTVYINTTRSV